MPNLEKFGATGRSCFVIASLKLLKDIEYLENKWQKENRSSPCQQVGLAPNPARWPFSSMRSHSDWAISSFPENFQGKSIQVQTLKFNWIGVNVEVWSNSLY
jgi:hypothetical protein